MGGREGLRNDTNYDDSNKTFATIFIRKLSLHPKECMPATMKVSTFELSIDQRWPVNAIFPTIFKQSPFHNIKRSLLYKAAERKWLNIQIYTLLFMGTVSVWTVCYKEPNSALNESILTCQLVWSVEHTHTTRLKSIFQTLNCSLLSF